MKRILSFVLCVATSSIAAPPSIEPFDGARYMFVGASATSHHRWPAYFAAYFSLRHPQYKLHFAMDARGGTSISRMFGQNEFGWDTDGALINHHVHYRTVQPWEADFVFIQHAESGGYAPEEDAQHRQSYIENYLKPDGMVPIIINGWQSAEPVPGSSQSQNEEIAIDALAVANNWNSSTIFDLTASKWGTEYSYTANAETDVITAVGHPFVNGMRVRMGRRTGTHAVPLGNAPNDYYVRDVSGNTFKLALTGGGEAIDITAAQTGDLRISRKWALINGHDNGHSGAAGYMVLFKYMMDSLELDTSVSQATINAATHSVTSQNQCAISNVSANAYDGVDFQRLDNRLPYVLDDDWWAEAVELEPDLLTHQDYSMTVTGLPAGKYEIHANGVLIGSATAAQLAAGWNMAALQVGPVFEKGKEVLGRIRDAQGRARANHDLDATLPSLSPPQGFERFKSTAAASYDVNGNRGADHMAALATQRAKLDDLDELIHAAAQPETITFSIRNSGVAPISAPTGVEIMPGE
jgi:hypothetical protein